MDAFWALGAGARANTGAPCRKAGREHPRGHGGHAGVDGEAGAWQIRSRSCLARLPLSGLEQDGPALDVDTSGPVAGAGPAVVSTLRDAVEASSPGQQALFGGLSAFLGLGSGSPPHETPKPRTMDRLGALGRSGAGVWQSRMPWRPDGPADAGCCWPATSSPAP